MAQSPLDNQRLIHERIADSTFVVFEQSGHFPLYDEPERYRDVLRAFLERVPVD